MVKTYKSPCKNVKQKLAYVEEFKSNIFMCRNVQQIQHLIIDLKFVFSCVGMFITDPEYNERFKSRLEQECLSQIYIVGHS